MTYRTRTEVTPEILRTEWDPIVIGSGLAGMTAGVSLAHHGKSC